MAASATGEAADAAKKAFANRIGPETLAGAAMIEDTDQSYQRYRRMLKLVLPAADYETEIEGNTVQAKIGYILLLQRLKDIAQSVPRFTQVFIEAAQNKTVEASDLHDFLEVLSDNEEQLQLLRTMTDVLTDENKVRLLQYYASFLMVVR